MAVALVPAKAVALATLVATLIKRGQIAAFGEQKFNYTDMSRLPAISSWSALAKPPGRLHLGLQPSSSLKAAWLASAGAGAGGMIYVSTGQSVSHSAESYALDAKARAAF